MASSPAPSIRKVVKAFSEDVGRRRREESAVALKKTKKEESLNKKRLILSALGEETDVTVPEELSIVHLASYVEEEHPPVREVLATNVLPRLVELLESEDGKVVFEAAWAITNIASTDYTKTVVDSGALPKLVAGMMHADANVREQCLWCVGNITGDCAEFRDAAFNTPDAVNNLLVNIQHPENVKLLRNATWSLSNFCRGKPAPSAEAAAAVLPALVYLTSATEDTAVLSDALWGLCYLTDSEERLLDAVLATGVLPRVIALLAHAELGVSMPALRVIGNVVSGNDRHTQAAVDAGALAALVPMLRTGRRNVKREACWAISNVAAGTHAQIGAMLAVPGLVAAVVETMRAAEWHVRKEAAWIVCNTAAAGTPEHVCRIVACGVVEPLVDVLGNDDPRMLAVVMDAMDAILAVEKAFVASGNPAAAMCRFAEQFRQHGAFDRLEELQEHASVDVYTKAHKLMRAYGLADEDEEVGDDEGEGIALGENDGPAAIASSAAPKMFAFGAAPAASSLFAPAAAPFGGSSNSNTFGAAPIGGLKALAAAAAAAPPAAAPSASAASGPYSFGAISFV